MADTTIDEFFQRVQAATEGTPYAVTRTGNGFDLGLDIVDARWFGLLNQAGLKKTYVHHVSMPEPGSYTISDESRTLDWSAGVPTVAKAEVMHGRVIEFGRQKVWGLDDQGRFGVQADYSFDSEEGRDLLTGIADQLGLKQRRGGAEKIGLYVGLGAIAMIVLAGIVVGILALLGKLG